MSGIIGLVNLNNAPLAAHDLDALAATLAHRGPDGVGLWHAGTVGLAHLKLATTPALSRETWPLWAGHLTLTADARLDNQPELRAVLNLPHDASDGAIILAAYEKWGTRCAEHLLGDFAFTLWDARRHTLFAARDHLGIKPFYYYHAPQFFVCASEIKALLAHPDVPRRVNPQRVAEFLSLLECESRTGTFYQHIYRLPPAHWLELTPHSFRVQKYWELDPHRAIRLANDAEYAAQFHALFTEAVRCRLPQDAVLGSVLSGGLDSACVTATANELLDGAAWQTLSIFFHGAHGTDERPYIHDVLARCRNFTAHEIDGTQLQPTLQDVQTILHQQDAPVWYPFVLPLKPLYETARANGVRVLLDGNDGDSTVASCDNSYLPELLRTGRWRTFAHEVNASRPSFTQAPRPVAVRWLKALRNHGFHTLLKEPVARAWHTRRGTLNELWETDFINPALAAQVGLWSRLAQLKHYAWQPACTAREAHFRMLTNAPFPTHWEMLNHAASAYGLEYRHPFADKRLVEFCLAIPTAQKLARGQQRAIMRRALQKLLPPSVYERSGKGGVTHQYVRALLRQPEARTLLVPPDNAVVWRYVHADHATNAYHSYLDQEKGAAAKLWHVAALTLWLHYQLVDKRAELS